VPIYLKIVPMITIGGSVPAETEKIDLDYYGCGSGIPFNRSD
jgi:hypothetical protein